MFYNYDDADMDLIYQYYESGNAQYELRIEQGRYSEFWDGHVVEMKIEHSLISGDKFEIGTAIPAKMTFKLRYDSTLYPFTTYKPYIRLKGEDGETSWIPMGVFMADSAVNNNGIWTIEAYDALITANRPYISQLTYPATMRDVWEEICGELGVYTNYEYTEINPIYTIPAGPSSFTMREVLGHIAAAHGASVVVDREGYLKFVKFESWPQQVLSLYKSQIKPPTTGNYVGYYKYVFADGDDDENPIVLGSGDEHLTMYINMPWKTADMCNNVYLQIRNFGYYRSDITAGGIPIIDTGDGAEYYYGEYSRNTTVVLRMTHNYKGGLVTRIESPAPPEVASKYGAQGSISSAINNLNKNSLKLNKNYYGVSFTREQGFKVQREDGKAESVWNADEFSLKAMVDGVMKDKLYFDPVKGEYFFSGKLTADALDALKGEIDVVVSNVTITNVLAADKGYIAELTVDQLETSDKVQKYLANDKSDVNYIRADGQYIHWITASTNGTATEQVEDRNGNKLYWEDDTKKAVTIEETDYPVLTYVYTEKIKRSVGFETIGGEEIPIDVFGTGTGSGNGRGQGFIRKATDGLELEYINQYGTSRMIKLGDTGISMTHPNLDAIAFYDNGFTVRYGNDIIKKRWTTGSSGRIISLEDVDTGETTTISWHDGETL